MRENITFLRIISFIFLKLYDITINAFISLFIISKNKTMKIKYLSDNINNLEEKDLNFTDILNFHYQFYEGSYNIVNQNNFFIKNFFLKIYINIIKYLIQIIFTNKKKIPNFLEEINSLITKKFRLFLIKNF